MSKAGSITVAVRVRPPTAWEAARLPEPPSFDSIVRGDGTLSSPRKGITCSNVRDVIEIADDRILTFDPPDRDAARAFSERGFVPPGSKRYKDRRFMFDRVFDGNCRQIDVYESTARPLLDGLLDGYNATVFAYGATGCGKTYTISGVDDDPGLVYLAMADLFQRLQDRKDDTRFEVAVTFLEIYNEEIRDLLVEGGSPASKGGLAIREDTHVKVVNLTELRPSNADEVKQIVHLGNQRRTQSPTHANETSSRSHAVLQVHVSQSPRTASTTETRTMATLSIIDLAGSERASATKNMGERMVEGANINKSLLALGNCINALCESGGTTRHIPYRNSKLTRLLKFSLGGNCKTVMVVCVAPTSVHFDDTHNALVYAERATKIKTKVVTRNVLNVNRHVGQYVEAINRLNEEVTMLKAKLAGRLENEAEIAKRKHAEALQEVQRAKSDIRTKSDQSLPIIADGAHCKALLAIADIEVSAFRQRIETLEGQAATAPQDGSSAEKSLLEGLIESQEALLRQDSAVNSRLAKASNAESLLDAMLRAVTERRTGRLDDATSDNVRLEARCKRAEVDRIKAEEQLKTLTLAFTRQTEHFIKLLNITACSTVGLRSAAHRLYEGLDNSHDTVTRVLNECADRNEATCLELGCRMVLEAAKSPKKTRQSLAPKKPPTSSYGQTSRSKGVKRSSGTSISPQKSIRSPRKGRQSTSKKVRAGSAAAFDGEKKIVRWKDEEDNGGQPAQQKVASVEIASKGVPFAGSESEWEDEKTDDSVQPSSLTGKSSRRSSLMQKKRSRSSRFEPNYLKSNEPRLESLDESDESPMPMPFAERINQSATPILSNLTESCGKSRLERRVPSSMFAKRSRSSSIGPVRSLRSRRRSSAIHEQMRTTNENNNPHTTGGARRVAVGEGKQQSPSRRVKRSSDSKSSSATPLSHPTKVYVPPTSNADISGDSSRGSKPLWR